MLETLTQAMDGLRARYAEPHRAYHGQARVDAMLDGLREIRHAFAGPEAAELAVWSHDAIYDPAASDNEARSAALMLDQMTDLMHPTLLQRAATMIRATATHAVPPGLAPNLVRDAALFLDLDLAVLGADPATYDAYERGIAAEYSPVHGEARFRAGRLAFLQTLLARPAERDRQDGADTVQLRDAAVQRHAALTHGGDLPAGKAAGQEPSSRLGTPARPRRSICSTVTGSSCRQPGVVSGTEVSR